MSRERAIEELLEGAWGFHGVTESDATEIGLERDVLRYVLEQVEPGDRTLETGTGYSTIAFALAGAEHTAVSPVPWEHERIREWCAERDISLAGVTLIEEFSQDALPRLGDEALDFVLIDGDHSFPTVFVDFFYTARRLRVGGQLVVDDTHIRTGDILTRFLLGEVEAGRWRLERRFPTSAVFRRLNETLIDLAGWPAQPFCAELLPPHGAPLWDRIRVRARLRSRMRRLLGNRRTP